MAEGKLEEQLRMALETPMEEREQTLDLNVGYEEADDTWELIVRYYDSLEAVERELEAQVVTLLNNYAVVTIRADRIGRLTEYPQVLYVESPKQYYFSVEQGRNVSCVDPVQSPRIPVSERLYGEGVLIAIPDSGIDYTHPDFRREDGTTRIVALWDQTAEYDGNRYGVGRIFSASAINASLQDGSVLSTDRSGHGTGVAGIAAGNGTVSDGRYAGVAPEAELIVVKLSEGRTQGFARTSSIMFGVDFALRVSGSLGRPLVLNLSYGNSYGAHNGQSLLEEYLNEAALVYRSSIVIATGNEGNTDRHGRVRLIQNGGTERLSFVVGAGEPTLNLQIWKNYFDLMEITLIAPSGERRPLIYTGQTERVTIGGAELLILYGDAKPYTGQQEIYIEFLPIGAGDSPTAFPVLPGGVWQIEFVPVQIREGTVDSWLPAGGLLLPETEFLEPSPETTLTIPATASRAIAVSAYNGDNGIYAAFSGQGYDRGGGRKPDLSAPGVDVYTTSPGGGYARRTGTSFAAPFVAGGAALLMEWGIVKGNDPFLYGEKLKSYLIDGAQPMRGITEYPDPRVGWGALCVAESFPEE